MNEKVFNELPEEIRAQIDSLIQDGENREQYASIWKKKFDLFTGQIANIGMVEVDSLEKEDGRGAILLTYSGSLISFGPSSGGKHWLEYASIKFRSDVPDFVQGLNVSRPHTVAKNHSADFEGCALKQTSAIYRIAVCPVGTKTGDQDQRIREATIYLTNGFVKLNKTLAGDTGVDVDQFTQKCIIAYVAKKNGITQIAAKAIIDDYITTVESGILLGERVTIGKLGAATLKLQAAKKARVMKNISTGEDILVPAKPASWAPKFAFSKTLKEKSTLVKTEGDA